MLTAGFVIDHRTWAPGRKTDIDPTSLATDRAFRPGATAPTAPQEDLDMTPEQLAAAVATGVNAALGAWLPRAVAAMNGRANAFFPDAALNDDDEQAADAQRAAVLAAQQETNRLLAQLVPAQPDPASAPGV